MHPVVKLRWAEGVDLLGEEVGTNGKLEIPWMKYNANYMKVGI